MLTVVQLVLFVGLITVEQGLPLTFLLAFGSYSQYWVNICHVFLFLFDLSMEALPFPELKLRRSGLGGGYRGGIRAGQTRRREGGGNKFECKIKISK